MEKRMLIFVIATCMAAGLASGAVINANSCSHADVQEAVNKAAKGDTVNVPAGSCTWTSSLNIDKAIELFGAGIGNTTIRAGTDQMAMVRYTGVGDGLRISGFSFDMNNLAYYGLKLSVGTTRCYNNRIDNCRFFRNTHPAISSRMIQIDGMFFGVVDNNIFDGNLDKVFDSYGHFLGLDYWELYGASRAYGSADNIYFEDNTVNHNTTVTSSGYGGRYCLRFNTYNIGAGFYPLWDAHGNQDAHAGTMLVEIYKNTVNAGKSGGYLLDQRGAWALTWGNNVFTSNTAVNAAQIREEYGDDDPTKPPYNPGGYVQRVTNSYYWLNRLNNIQRLGTYIPNLGQCDSSCPQGSRYDNGCGYCIAANHNYWDESYSFDGTSGVGQGTMADRPVTCNTNVAYWATDCPDSNWNKANGNGNDGCLYKCQTANTWTRYYTPYTYPHPLRSGTTPPPTCNDECVLGHRECSGDGYRTCANHDSDSCTEWGGVTACAQGQSCSNGVCSSQVIFASDEIIEAESGMLEDMQSSSGYIYSPTPEKGQASFSFQIMQDGEYIMQALVNSNGDPGRNSFYVGFDNESAQGDNYYAYDTTVTSGFFWDNVSKRGTGTTSAEFDPMVWELSQGTHTFTFYGREANTWLDKIILKKACLHEADTDCDGCVRHDELMQYISSWKNGQKALAQLMEAIRIWKGGC